MALESSVRGGRDNGDYLLIADEEVDELRKAIWSTIYEEKGDLPIADVGFALSVVQYELLHHSDEPLE